MVLLNGVKYACERCIRGHRVTTCTHTDQPLTMIKPKGRPTTQCQHCREQRKSKSLHTACTCGKKGKAPGVHSPNCSCQKTSFCNCSNNKKLNGTAKDLHHMTASEKAKKKSLINVVNDDLKRKNSSSSSPVSINSNAQNGATFNSTLNTNYVIEDIVLPFETGTGLFDLFSGTHSPSQSNSQADLLGYGDMQKSFDNSTSNLSTYNNDKDIYDYTSASNDLENFPSSPKDSPKDIDLNYKNNYDPSFDSHFTPNENDLVDRIFPLFPLIGNASFDNKNQPLLGIRKEMAPSITSNSSVSNLSINSATNPSPVAVIPNTNYITNTTSNNTITNTTSNIDAHNDKNNAQEVQAKPMANNSSGQGTNGSSSIPASTSHSNNSSSGGSTPIKPHQPKPIRPATNPSTHYQPIRPKRPESVISVASNSSSRSFDVNNHNSSFVNGIPNATNSAAYPPSVPKTHVISDLSNFERVDSSTNMTLNENNSVQDEDNLFNPGQIYTDDGKMTNNFGFMNFNNFNSMGGGNLSATNSIDNSFGQPQLDIDLDIPLFSELMSPITEAKSNSNTGANI